MSNPTFAKAQRSQLGLNSLLTIVLALAVLAMANYVGFRYYVRHDFSKGSYYKLSDKTVKILKNLPDEVEITTLMANSGLRSEIENLLREYRYKGGSKIKLEFIDAGVDIPRAEELIRKYNLDPKQENVIVIEYKDRHKVINDSSLAEYSQPNPFTGEAGELKAFKGEAQFTAAIQALVEGKTAKVYFLTGHGERDLADTTNPVGIGGLKIYIERDNLTAAPLNLAHEGAIPKDADALVIAGPRSPLTANEVQAIATYLADKGKVILFQDPQAVTGLEPVAQQYGIVLQDTRVLGALNMAGKRYLLNTAIGTEYADHPAVRLLKGMNLKMDNARSLALLKDPASPNVSKATALVKTPAGFWGETNLEDPNPQFNPGADIPGPLILAVAYDGGEIPGDGAKLVGSRLVVVGGSTFLTNGKLDMTGLDFFLSLLNWELQKNLAIGISPKAAQEFGLNVSPLQKSTIIVLALALAPGLAFLTGTAVWFSRRR
ncbi:MAG: GldG family protein [Verrucomicrobium sp.]|nr:GldG family protein [Verrucomicrobium sp.]